MKITIEVSVFGGTTEARASHRQLRGEVLRALENLVRYGKETSGAPISGHRSLHVGQIDCRATYPDDGD